MKGEFRAVRCFVPGLEAIIGRSRHSFQRHSHEQYGIGVIDQGGQLWHSRRGQVEAGPNNVISVSPGEVHDGDAVGDAGRTWRMLYIDPAIVARLTADGTTGAGPFELPRPVLQDARLAGLVRALFEAVTSPAGSMLREELMLEILSAMGKPGRHQAKPGSNSPIEIARSRIDDAPCAPTTLAELAALCGLNIFQFIRAFKQSSGFTPHAYIIQRRVQLAKSRIAKGEALANVAADIGFADQSHMTRAFVSRYGISPARYAAATAPLD